MYFLQWGTVTSVPILMHHLCLGSTLKTAEATIAWYAIGLAYATDIEKGNTEQSLISVLKMLKSWAVLEYCHA